MKLHIQLSDNLAEKLLEEGLVGLPADFADTIRRTGTKRSEVIKLVIQRHLGKLEEPQDAKRVADEVVADIQADDAAEAQRIADEAAAQFDAEDEA